VFTGQMSADEAMILIRQSLMQPVLSQ